MKIQLHSLLYCHVFSPFLFLSHILLVSVCPSCHTHMCTTVTSICETLMHITAQQLDFDLFFSPNGSMTRNCMREEGNISPGQRAKGRGDRDRKTAWDRVKESLQKTAILKQRDSRGGMKRMQLMFVKMFSIGLRDVKCTVGSDSKCSVTP